MTNASETCESTTKSVPTEPLLDTEASDTASDLEELISQAHQEANRLAQLPAVAELLGVTLAARRLYQLCRERLAALASSANVEETEEVEMLLVRAVAQQAEESTTPDELVSGLGLAVEWAGRELTRPRQETREVLSTPWGNLPRVRSTLVLGELEHIREVLQQLSRLHAAETQLVLPWATPSWTETCKSEFVLSPKVWEGLANTRNQVQKRLSPYRNLSLLFIEDLAACYTAAPKTRLPMLNAGTAHQRIRQAAGDTVCIVAGLVDEPTADNARWCRELFQAYAQVWRVGQDPDDSKKLQLEVRELETYSLEYTACTS